MKRGTKKNQIESKKRETELDEIRWNEPSGEARSEKEENAFYKMSEEVV